MLYIGIKKSYNEYIIVCTEEYIHMKSKAGLCRTVVFGILTIVCMVLIFMFSSDNADKSSEKSGEVTKAVVEATVPDYEEMPAEKQESILDKAEHIVRKCAHFSIFMALGFCASCAVGRRKIFGIRTLAVVGFCFLYACSDEIHQTFIPGRAGMFTDVLIDTSGAVIGTIISLVMLAVFALVTGKKKAAD